MRLICRKIKQTNKLISARRPDLVIISYNNNSNNKRGTCRIVDFAISADHRVELKEREKKDKLLDLARALEKLWNLKVTVIPIDVGALDTLTEGLIQRLENW